MMTPGSESVVDSEDISSELIISPDLLPPCTPKEDPERYLKWKVCEYFAEGMSSEEVAKEIIAYDFDGIFSEDQVKAVCEFHLNNSDEPKTLAEKILRKGDPISFFRETFQSIHCGDQPVIDAMVFAAAAQCGKNTRGIQPSASGPKGAGKSSSIRAALHLLPPEIIEECSLSSKSLFYEENPKPARIIFSDDTVLQKDILDTIKRAMSNFQEPTVHRTVEKNQGKLVTREVEIPPRQVYLFTSVYDSGDDQLNDRQYRISIDQTSESERAFVDFILEQAETGVQELPTYPEIEACREMLRIIRKRVYLVQIPFAKCMSFKYLSNKRDINYFLDFIRASAIIHMYQRERREPEDKEGIGPLTLMAQEEDFKAALEAFQVISATRRFNLTKEERALVDKIIEIQILPGIPITHVIRESGINTRKMYDLLEGRDKRGGILSKLPGVSVEKYSMETPGGKQLCRCIWIPPELKSSLDDYEPFAVLEGYSTNNYPPFSH